MATPPTSSQSSLPVSDLRKELSLLPQVMHILKCMHEGKDELELAKAVTALSDKLSRSLKIIEQLPPQLTPEQQVHLHQSLQAKLKRKCDLIEKYERMGFLSIATESYDMK